MESLRDKILVMIVGPTAIGKSTVMHRITELDTRFGYVNSFVTRPARPGEVSTYTHMTEREAHELHDKGDTVTFLVHPTTRVIYGTTADSFSHQYNLQDTLSYTVSTYRALPFKRTVTISLTADPDDWERWLDSRFPEPSDDRRKRLLEAKSSIEWSLAQTDDHAWVVNGLDGTESTARGIIGLTTGPLDQSPTPPEATKLLQRVKTLLSYEQKKE